MESSPGLIQHRLGLGSSGDPSRSEVEAVMMTVDESLTKCVSMSGPSDRHERAQPMRSLLAAQLPEMGKVWARLFGQASDIGWE